MSHVIAALFVVLLPTPSARPAEFSVGPSLSYVTAQEHVSGWAYGLDLTYVLPTESSAWWASGGMRTVQADDAYAVAYVEGGAWLFANVGIGYSHSFGNPLVAGNNVHAFIGIPIPLYGMSTSGRPGFYLEPYYRPMFGLGGRNRATIHEMGLLIKYTPIKVWSDDRVERRRVWEPPANGTGRPAPPGESGCERMSAP